MFSKRQRYSNYYDRENDNNNEIEIYLHLETFPNKAVNDCVKCDTSSTVLYNFKMKSAGMASLCCINSIQVCIQTLVNELQMQSLPHSTIIVYINSITVYISSIIVHLTVPLYTLTVSLYTLNVITDDIHSIIRMCYELKLCVKRVGFI